MKNKVVFIGIILFLWSSLLFSSTFINPDNPGWVTLDSIFVGAKDSNGLKLPFIYKLIKTKPSSYLYFAQNTQQNPNYFYLRGSNDNGLNWTNIYVDSINPNQYILPTRLDMIYKNNILLISGEQNKIFRSEDYAQSFNLIEIQSKAKMDLFDIDMIKNVALTQFSGTMFKSIDSGKNWSYLDIMIDTTLFLPIEFYMITDSVYFVRALPDLNDRYSYLMTYDAGLSWKEVYKAIKGSDSAFSRFKFINKDVGYALFSKQTKKLSYYNISLFKTYDGGKSWNKIYSDKDSTFGPGKDLYYLNDQLVFHSSNSVYYFKDDKNIFKHSITFEGKTNLLKYINDILITDENEIMIAYGTRICKWSPTLEVNNNLTPDNIISPNPAIDYISVSHSALDAESTIEIFNILGESVTTTPPIGHTFELEGEKIRIDISNLLPGVYFIKIDDKFEKFIKL